MGLSDTRNVVDPATAEDNRTGLPGGYTFHAPIPEDYFGIAFTVAVVRLGDHAHLDIDTGRHNPASQPYGRGRTTRGFAGRLVLRWPEWLLLRGALDAVPWAHIAEVENPTHAQLTYHTPDIPPVVAA